MERSVPGNDKLYDDRETVRIKIQRCEVGREFLRKHGEYLGDRVHRSGILSRVIVKRCAFLDKSIHIGNGDEDFRGTPRKGFGHGKLVQVARIVVVDGAPEKAPEIAVRAVGR